MSAASLNPDWQENELFFDFSKALRVVPIDDRRKGSASRYPEILSNCPNISNLSHTVDFVVEWKDEIWFIEVKDPSATQIPSQHREAQLSSFQVKLLSDSLFQEELYPKFHDSLIYWVMDERLSQKKLFYFALLEIPTLDVQLLSTLSDRLKAIGFLKGPPRGWSNPFEARVFNIDHWNRFLKDRCPVQRISSASDDGLMGNDARRVPGRSTHLSNSGQSPARS
ncbi:hypothetical protein [Geothrix sp. 21YS21S-4]|uniref:hypothetical protein n=1 Tax=Geothrix sp. 21YS21S-4 TaxID=3068889 RepID=UPI0027B9ED83|nr:hypothetical protein [Geothrix sp. 21YS21S-4]